MRTRTLFGAAMLFAGCTFSTGASDRKVVDMLDFDFTLKGFRPHAMTAVDIALVSPSEAARTMIPGPNATSTHTQMYTVRGRVRVMMPPDPDIAAPKAGVQQAYPDVKVTLQHFLDEQYLGTDPLQVLFYADGTGVASGSPPDFSVEPLDDQMQRKEHSWILDLPRNGQLSFTHFANFQNFYDDEEVGVGGGNLVLDVPPNLDAHPAQGTCLQTELAKIMKDSLEVRLIFNPDVAETQTAGFKMFAGNSVPTVPILFKGLSDTDSQYDVRPYVDGVLIKHTIDTAPAAGLTIPFDQWFPISTEALTACLALQ